MSCNICTGNIAKSKFGVLTVVVAVPFLDQITGLYKQLNPTSKLQRNTLCSGLRSGLGGMRGA